MGYDKDRLKNSLTLEQIASIVEELGGNPTFHGEMLMCDTICHNLPGEGSHKLYYYDNTKLFNCYTGCHESFDIFQLIIKVYDVQYNEIIKMPKSVSYIAYKVGYSGEDNEEFDDMVSEDWAIFKSYERIEKNRMDNSFTLKEYDESILNRLAHPKITLWEDEGILAKTMDKYEISYYPKDCQIILPHRDINGKLVGIRGRTLVKEEGKLYGKYRPAKINGYMYSHPLGFNLYGLDKNKGNIKTIKKAIVFEGEKSVMLYDSYFGSENNIAVASCGSSISAHQFELLRGLGITEMVIAFDRQFEEIGDKEFKVLVKTLKLLSAKYKGYVTVSCIFDKNKITDYKSSPIDHGRDTFIKLFNERIYV